GTMVALLMSKRLKTLEPKVVGTARAIRIGISACLLGEHVRFDGGHKKDAFLTDVLAPHVEWIQVCPDVQVGMGTPRETLRLPRRQDGIHMVTTRSAVDHTDAMTAYSEDRVERLASEDLD